MDRKYGVNYPSKFCMKLHTCHWVKRSTSDILCGQEAYKSDVGIYCNKHYKMVVKKQAKKIEETTEWTDKHIELGKKYKVLELKQILRDNKKKVSGSKSELIDRIVQNKLI